MQAHQLTKVLISMWYVFRMTLDWIFGGPLVVHIKTGKHWKTGKQPKYRKAHITTIKKGNGKINIYSMWFVGNGIKGDPGKFMANLLNERKRKKCVFVCRVQQFFSHITTTVYECSRELYAHFKIVLPHLNLKRGRPALALPNKSASSTLSNLRPPVPRSGGYTEDGKKRYAITLLSIHTELCPPLKGRGTYCFWCGSCWRQCRR